MQPSYDRREAAQVLATLAADSLFDETSLPQARQINFHARALTKEPDSQLTVSQRLYLEKFMLPCRPEQITSATHRLTWTDSAGIPNTGHFHAEGLGPQIPIVAREAVLALWAELATNAQFAARISQMSDHDRAVLTGTTTDHDPHDIFRVGVEAAGRVLAQHALLAAHTPYRTAQAFARGLYESGIFTVVATHWFWELQASTYRRGMIPVSFTKHTATTVRYTKETVATLRAMKAATIADAHTVMHRATGEEGLTPAEAIAKYHDDLDLISRQYALLPADTQPTCLAAMSSRERPGSDSVLTLVAARLTARFLALVPQCTITAQPVDISETDERITSGEQLFYVPDMTCKHCVRTVGGVLESLRIPVVEVDLASKRVIAEFRSLRNRSRAFEALRDGGYNPVDEHPHPANP